MHTTRSDIRRLVGLLVLVGTLVMGVVVTGGSSLAGGDSGRRPMLRETNKSRVTHNVGRVDIRAKLSELARRHSLRMARRGELFHTSNPPAYYLRGIRWSYWGENVGYTSGTVGGLQRQFMRSPAHRANVLNRRFRHTAIGTVRRGGTLWVTVFFYG